MTRDQMINHLILTGWEPMRHQDGTWLIWSDGLRYGCTSDGKYYSWRLVRSTRPVAWKSLPHDVVYGLFQLATKE